MEYFSRDFNRFLATRIVYEYSIPFRLSRLTRRESRLERRVSSREKRDATGNLHLTNTVAVQLLNLKYMQFK